MKVNYMKGINIWLSGMLNANGCVVSVVMRCVDHLLRNGCNRHNTFNRNRPDWELRLNVEIHDFIVVH